MRQEKQLLLDEMAEKIADAESMVFMSYNCLTPNSAASLRDAIAKAGSDFSVVRKRVFLKALQEAKIDVDSKQLQGHIAVLFSGEDVVESTKAIFNFSDDNPDVLTVLGGHFEGKACTFSDVKMLSELPGKQEMRAQLLGVLEAPMGETLGTVEALLTSVIHCLENKSMQEE